jgi:LPS sulfotransferase NodH
MWRVKLTALSHSVHHMRTRAVSVWNAETRPRPADLREAAYDLSSAPPVRHKLLICAAPRSSSKRLARLLIGAGLGVPMEYLNDTTVNSLTARWQIPAHDYLTHLYRRRSANGVFASNLQHRQIAAWPYPQDIDELFSGAHVVHLVRPDKSAQAASLAACWLTGEWGFEEPVSCPECSPARIKRAARKALAFVAAEDEHLQRWFTRYHVDAVRVTSDEVNRADLTVVASLAARLDVEPDRAGAERMLRCDDGPYRGHEALKARLRECLPS